MLARVVVGALLAAAAAKAEGASKKLTVDEMVKSAIEASPDVAAARARRDAAQAGADAVRGRMLPAVRLTDEQQHYDSPFVIQFGPGPGLTARNINTNTFVAAAGQPLVGLLHLSQDHAAASSTADGAAAQERALESGVREGVQAQLLRLFQARALADVARASEQQIQEQIDVTKARLAAGAGTNADVLRIQVAQANARQQEIQAEAQATIARASLLTALGVPVDDTTVDFEEPTALLTDARPLPVFAAGRDLALGHRPELAATRLAADAADHTGKARLYDLLPEVSLEAAYVHIHGQLLAPADEGYVGLKVDWPIWSWGASWYAKEAAASQAEAAAHQAEGTRRQVLLDVQSRLSQAGAAADAVAVAQATIASAEEAYRVTQALVKAGSGTTTDLLDAEAALTQAKLNLTRARYDQAIARVALDRATGG